MDVPSDVFRTYTVTTYVITFGTLEAPVEVASVTCTLIGTWGALARRAVYLEGSLASLCSCGLCEREVAAIDS